MKLTTWNINSVRLRMPLVRQFLQEHSPDVLCLQETKCRNAEFPSAAFRAAGYPHLALNGQKGYHGVAIVSRLPLEKIGARGFCGMGDARHIQASVELDGAALVVHNFYVPAGGDEPDPRLNPKFAHKLGFLDEMAAWFEEERVAQGRTLLAGDLNIAPLEQDVWSHKALIDVVSHTPIEVEKLDAAFRAGPWVDAMRRFVPEQEKLYTWWSYRASDWAKSDRGRRLDHIWVSEALAGGLQEMSILREARSWARPSDHAPVTVVLEG